MMSFGRWLTLGCLAAVAGSLCAAVDGTALQRLVADSPFQPQGVPVLRVPEPMPLEFRGYVFEGGEKLFSVRDAANRTSLWLRLNEPVDGVVARQFDAGAEVLRLEHAGRSLALPLTVSKPVEWHPAAPLTASAQGAAQAEQTGAITPEVQAAEQNLARARQKQAYEERRRLALERRQLGRSGSGATK